VVYRRRHADCGQRQIGSGAEAAGVPAERVSPVGIRTVRGAFLVTTGRASA
jgi:hypothetical protein